ncbi:DUF6234 family protein [Streptomyces sp. NPDC056039]|uniref:DUF6234 family protein n=1 Tax=Streptomyces sp. NPDC056039 TaxID=3345687 RepID=UPI0035DFE2E9
MSPPPTGRRRLPLAGDIVSAAALLVLDGIGAAAAFLFGVDYSGWKPFDAGADNSGIALTPDWLYVGLAGGIMLLTAAPLFRLRALVSACVQVLVGIAVLVVAVGGAQFDEQRGAGAGANAPGLSVYGASDRP